MFSLAYSIPLDLRARLTRLQTLRQTILGTPISWDQEHMLRWEAKRQSIAASLRLSGIQSTSNDAYQRAINLIEDQWTASTRTVDFPVVAMFARLTHTTLTQKHAIQKLLDYLDTQEEQPIIQAALALGFLSASILGPNDPGLVARLLSRLFLAKHGFDLRGLAAVERQWEQVESSYRNALAGSTKRENMTEWILFYVESLEHEFARCLKSLESVREPTRATRLTERQRAIVHLVDDPARSITNRAIQKHFRISQITASRELTLLTALGLLRPHGKGRSVSYTAI